MAKNEAKVLGRPVVYGEVGKSVESKEFYRLVEKFGLTKAQAILKARKGTKLAELRNLKGFSKAALKLLHKISLPTLRTHAADVLLARGPRPAVEEKVAA
jgi:hypothetical protein